MRKIGPETKTDELSRLGGFVGVNVVRSKLQKKKTTGRSLNHHDVSQADVSNPYAHEQAPTLASHYAVRPFTTRNPLPFWTSSPTFGWAPRCEECVGGCCAVFLSLDKTLNGRKQIHGTKTTDKESNVSNK
jgi:hypothetical protein